MATKVFTDQMNRKVEVQFPPQRIVSVVPSQTELLFALGLNERVTGVTKFCIHPKIWWESKTKIGGTKKLHIDEIRKIKPDLIIANKEENTQAEIEQLAQEFPVWISDIQQLNQAIEMIRSIGEICNCSTEAEKITAEIIAQFGILKPISPPKSALYLIWQEPFMSVSADTFIHDMMIRSGFKNCMAESSTRYPEVSEEQIKALKPDLILLSSEPFPFSEKHKQVLQARFPKSLVVLVDGKFFSWYGSRLTHAPEYFKQLIASIA
jgi:ABC-type Fe3+-hydroxamate transport system substrate-binding protein